MQEEEKQQALSNPFLAQALEKEKMEGHRLAIIARTVALVVVGLLLPFLNFSPSVLYYEATLLLFIALGWLQLRLASVGYSKSELLLIFADLSLLTLLFITPNPFFTQDIPTAFMLLVRLHSTSRDIPTNVRRTFTSSPRRKRPAGSSIPIRWKRRLSA